jgi:hypothetical protein
LLWQKKAMGFHLGKKFGLAALAVFGCASCATPVDFGQPGHRKRYLTDGEVEMAKAFFAAQLDTTDITIRAVRGKKSMGVNNQISMSESKYSDDYAKVDSVHTKSVFMHELTHIWQEQNGVDLPRKAISSFFKFGGNYSESYKYDLNKERLFKKLTIEQQAKMVADYYRNKENLASYNATQICPDMLKRQQILKQAFTHLKTPALCK